MITLQFAFQWAMLLDELLQAKRKLLLVFFERNMLLADFLSAVALERHDRVDPMVDSGIQRFILELFFLVLQDVDDRFPVRCHLIQMPTGFQNGLEHLEE